MALKILTAFLFLLAYFTSIDMAPLMSNGGRAKRQLITNPETAVNIQAETTEICPTITDASCGLYQDMFCANEIVNAEFIKRQEEFFVSDL